MLRGGLRHSIGAEPEWSVCGEAATAAEALVSVPHVQPDLVTVGDERLLRRVFDHLLANAWQFTPPEEPVQVSVSGERVAGRLRITVRDRGIGFDPRHAHKLFEPLQRLHGPQEGARHGLGLATALDIVQRHGGTLTGSSRPGDGAEFTVELPLPEGDRADA